MLKHTGRQWFFDSEEDVRRFLLESRIEPGSVWWCGNEGPKGGPGMREMSISRSHAGGMGLHRSVAMVTDGRYSGATRGPCIGHSARRQWEGGANLRGPKW